MNPAFRAGPSQLNGAEVRPSAGPFAELGFDAIAPSQYYDARHPSVSSDGERRLMLAVLKTAISDYLQGSDPRTRESRRRSDEVGAWIGDRSTASGVFAYEEVCESLGIDADRLRKRLSSLESRSVVLRLRSLPVRPANQLPSAAR
jgi:hypothetical protein